MSIKTLREDVLTKTISNEQIFQKHFIDSQTYFFTSGKVERNLEYSLKKEIAEVLDIHINDIYIVGSGKTGFSIKPKNEFGKFDRKFKIKKILKNKSDIDIAIVNTKLFDKIQENIYDWSNGFKTTWTENLYYDASRYDIPLKYIFLEYLGKGWYRPDLAPIDFKVETRNGTLDIVINKWKGKFDRKIAFAVYKNWHFFKKYQLETLELLKNKINSGEI